MTKYGELSWGMRALYIAAIFFLFGAMGYMASHGGVGHHFNKAEHAAASATQNQ